MKILFCTDGSEQSQKALEETSVIAGGCGVDEVAIIHVYDSSIDSAFPYYENVTTEQIENFQQMIEDHKKERERILAKSKKFLEKKNIKARIILKEGHPSHTIVEVAQKEGFDMIVLGSRGLGGLKKIFLGSVSNAVIQEAKNCSILVVK